MGIAEHRKQALSGSVVPSQYMEVHNAAHAGASGSQRGAQFPLP